MGEKPFGLVVPDYSDPKESYGVPKPYFGDKVWEALSERTKDFNRIIAKVERKSDETEKTVIVDSARGKKVYVMHSQYLMPARHIMIGAQIADALRRADAEKIILFEPYNPYLSYDKRDRYFREPITARIVADFYEKNGVDRVFTVDPHSGQSEGFFTAMDPLYLTPFVAAYIKNHYDLKNFVVSPPDDGRSETSEEFAELLELEEVKMHKKRNAKGEEVDQLGVLGDVKGKKVLIVDDVIRKGTTIEKSYEALKEAGAGEVMVYATHIGLYGDAYERLTGLGIKIIGTNSIPQRNHRNIDIIDISVPIAEVIHRRTSGRSVSEYMRSF